VNDKNESGNANVMMVLMTKIIPTCEEVSQLTSLAMDEKLTLRQKIGVKFHLMFCKWCRLFSKQMIQVRSTIKTKSLSFENLVEKPDFKLSTEFKNRLKKSVEDNK